MRWLLAKRFSHADVVVVGVAGAAGIHYGAVAGLSAVVVGALLVLLLEGRN